MVEKQTWEIFKDSGLLWFTNMILHTFGWSIVFEYDKDSKICAVYPARVKFRGFSEKHNSEGYIKISEYLKNNIESLEKEAKK